MHAALSPFEHTLQLREAGSLRGICQFPLR